MRAGFSLAGLAAAEHVSRPESRKKRVWGRRCAIVGARLGGGIRTQEGVGRAGYGGEPRDDCAEGSQWEGYHGRLAVVAIAVFEGAEVDGRSGFDALPDRSPQQAG